MITIHMGSGIVSQDEWWGFVDAKNWNKVLANTFDGFEATYPPLSDGAGYTTAAAQYIIGYDGVSPCWMQFE
jgi:hypothetical protein